MNTLLVLRMKASTKTIPKLHTQVFDVNGWWRYCDILEIWIINKEVWVSFWCHFIKNPDLTHTLGWDCEMSRYTIEYNLYLVTHHWSSWKNQGLVLKLSAHHSVQVLYNIRLKNKYLWFWFPNWPYFFL